MRRKLPNASQKVIALSLVLVTCSAQAASLVDYRNCAKVNVAQAEKAAIARSYQLRKALGTERVPGPEIYIPDNFGESSRINFSSHMKNILEEGSVKLYEELRHGAPVEIDPSMGLAEYREQKADLRERLVMDEFNSSKHHAIQNKVGAAGTEKVFGISALVADLFSHISSQYSLKKKEAQKKSSLSDSERKQRLASEQKYLEIIQKHIAGVPANKAATVLDALGKLNDLEIREGEIDEMHFTAADGISDRISLQLNMLLTYRTGMDNVYLEVLRILTRYFDEQHQVLTKRLDQINKGESDPGGISTMKVIKEMILSEGTFTAALNYYSGKEELAKTSVKAAAKKMLQEDPAHNYRMSLRRFLESKNIAFGSAEEKHFIVTRLNKLATIRPYMKKQFFASIETNKKLKKLSVTQVNYLIDMFLQLRGNDILSVRESAGMKLQSYFGDQAKSCIGNKGNVAVDFVYYRLTEKLMSHLETVLAEEAMLEKARKEDLATLSRHKPQ